MGCRAAVRCFGQGVLATFLGGWGERDVLLGLGAFFRMAFYTVLDIYFYKLYLDIYFYKL
jgi:hypothetical protein